MKREVRDFMTKKLHRDVTAVSDDESLLEMGVIDSMAVLELVSTIEQLYGITISDDDMMPENFDSIDAIAAFIAGRRSAGSQ